MVKQNSKMTRNKSENSLTRKKSKQSKQVLSLKHFEETTKLSI